MMHFVIARDVFVEALRTLQNVVTPKPTMPILGSVRIEGKEDRLTLYATDLDQAVRVTVKAQIKEPGVAALPIRRLTGIIAELPALDVVVKIAASGNASITSGGSAFKVNGYPADDFPAQPEVPTEGQFLVKQTVLKQHMARVEYAQSVDESRYFLNGIFFQIAGESLLLVATDGRRLAWTKTVVENSGNGGEFILPSKCAGTLQRLLTDDCSLIAKFSERRVAFAIETGEKHTFGVGEILYLSKIVEGKFPDYTKVIPKDVNGTFFMADRQMLADCIHRAALVTSDKSNSVRMALTKNELVITAASPDFGEAKEEMAVEYDGGPVHIAFNPDFVLHPLRALTADKIRFEVKDEVSPGVVRHERDFLCVVMPVRM